MALIATAGAIDANSYVDVATADAYFTERLHISAWSGAAVATKESALVWATRLLDIYWDWRGSRSYPNVQNLRWPRVGVWRRDALLVDYTTIPDFLITGTCELALQLVSTDLTVDVSSKGIASVSVKGVAVVFDKTTVKAVIPDIVIATLGPYGSFTDPSGSHEVNLVRT